MAAWLAWLARVWPTLTQRGGRAVVPSGLPHPSHAGFRKLTTSEPAGQIADWALSLRDGSRIHVHEFSGGRLVAHRDRIDPSRGVVAAGRHFFSETRAGKTAVVSGLVYGAARLVLR